MDQEIMESPWAITYTNVDEDALSQCSSRNDMGSLKHNE